jgi:L-arabonate dehydrase
MTGTRSGADVPTLVDLMPSGRFLMEDFFYAGGLPAVMRRLGEAGLPHPDALTVNGRSHVENNGKDAPMLNDEVIRPLDKPLTADGGIMVLRGNLAPDGAVLKPSAATPALLPTAAARWSSRTSRTTTRASTIPISTSTPTRAGAEELRPARLPRHGRGRQHGPAAQAAAGRHRHGAHLRRAHERHGLRHRGAARGARGGAGGPLALVRDGDMIELDAPNNRLNLDITDEELAARRAEWVAPEPPASGYERLFIDQILQADQGCDFNFLAGCRGAPVARDYV